MKIILAIDSFKGSLSSADAEKAVAEAIHNLSSNHEIVCIPIADGGEGTLSALVGEDSVCLAEVKGPVLETVKAKLGFLNDTAVIEMAQAAGLTLVDENMRSAKKATTYGVGEMIVYALNKGYRRFLLTAGGSATNDGGMGMLRALGFEVLDSLTNFVFAKTDKMSGEALYRELKRRGILVRHFGKASITDYNRITIGTKEQMEAFIATVKTILEELS